MQTQDDKKKVKRFQHSIENLRGLSILFVLLGHIGSFDGFGKVGKCFFFLFHDATTWFVFISGYLFNYIEKGRFDYYEFLKKKAKFVLLPYLVISFIGIGIGLHFKRDLIMGISSGAYALWSLIVGGAVIIPLWFIPMIIIFYIAAPVFVGLTKSWVQYPVLVLGLLAALFTARPLDNSNPFLSFVHFFGFYVLGLVVSENARRIENYNRSFLTVLIILTSLVLFALSSAIAVLGEAEVPLGFIGDLGRFNKDQFGKLVLLIAVFFMFNRYLNVPNRVLGYLAEISFGLFFVQGLFMACFILIRRRLDFSSPGELLATELVVVIGGSIVCVYIVKSVLGKKSRYVIGY
jgi:hypothetical protein